MATAKKTAKKKAATVKRSGRAASAVVHRIPTWTTAHPGWEDTIVAGKPLTPCPPLFQDSADDGWNVYSKLKMVDQGSAGDAPTFGELSLPWTRDFVEAVFGSECAIEGHPLEGRRLIKNFFMLISKKNGKSTLAAGIMLTALILNWRDSAEFLILSPTKEIADNSYKPIKDAIKADPQLDAMFQVQDHIRTITHRTTNATLKVVAADSQTVSGKKAVGILIDELHEFGKVAKASEMLTEATGGLMSRPEGFVIYLTTQSSEPPAGVFKDTLQYARKVRDGEIDDNTFYPIIYEFPRRLIDLNQHMLPANFYITNPNMGASVDETYLVNLIKKAQSTSQKDLQDKLAKHLNVEVGLNLADDNWPGARYWLQQAAKEKITIDGLIANCEVIVLGADGGGLDDLLGANALGRERGTGRWVSVEWAYAHRSVLERRLEIAPRLQDFANDGDLIIVEKVGDDTAHFAQIAKKVHESGLLFQIGMDPGAIGGLQQAFLDVGIPQEMLVGVTQGYKLAGCIKTTERYLAAGNLWHSGKPLMAWCAGNAKIVVRGNAIVVTKQVSGTAKIDPLIALFCSVAIMELNPPAQDYEFNFDMMRMVG